MQTFTAPISGDYKLEVWGAQGGGWNNYGGLGGYSIGYKSLSTYDNLYVCVGGVGVKYYVSSGGNGGYNGGGKGGNGFVTYNGGCGGGGATHIAITTNRGVLKNYENYQSEILLVAGGGGGNNRSQTGVGGGMNGGDAVSIGGYVISGATQTSGYAFGQGQDGKTKTIMGSSGAEGNGGGGGGFYGGPASQQEGENSDCSGAGGSGYIGGITNGATIAGDQTFPSPSGGTEQGHRDHGYAIITWQQLP